MNAQPSLPFDNPAQAAADASIDQAVQAANTAWKLCVTNWVMALEPGATFTADHIWDTAERRGWPTTHEPRALGILSHLSRRGFITSVASRKSTRVERHAGYVTVWRRTGKGHQVAREMLSHG